MVQDHGSAVRGYLLGLVRHAEVADDLAQETFRRLWLARDRYKEQGLERAYLIRIADHLVIDHSRRKRKEMLVDPQDWQGIEPALEEEEPVGELVRQEDMARVKKGMDLLSLAQRRVLLMRYYGDMEFQEIAKAMGCPVGTALSHCRRGLLALRALLQEGER